MTRNSSKKPSKGQRRDELERKRDDRARKNALRKEKKIKEYLEHDENFASFSNQLECLGFQIRDIPGDGNCLFRALGDQLDGDHTTHARHRRETVRYMKEHRADFEPFMEDNVSFDKHLEELSKLSTFGGNDSIVAFGRNHGVDIVIHQLNEPRWAIHGSEYNRNGPIRELHISYHNGDHYSSVRRLGDNSTDPAWMKHNQMTFPVSGATDSQHSTTKRKAGNAKDKRRKREKETISENSKQASFDPHESDELTPEQLVMTATGCKDVVVVAQTLEDNFYNVDASINYILQLMCLAEEAGCAAKDSFSGISDLPNEEGNLNCDSMEHVEALKSTDQTNGQEMLDDACLCPSEKNKEQLETRTYNSSAEAQLEIQEFVKDLRESLSESEHERKNYKNQGARPKVKTKNVQKAGNAHLSNKKRKELAKQEKKQRREDRKKEDLIAAHEPTVAGDQTVLEAAVDLGVLAI